VSTFRVLWRDAASEGRFEDIQADSEGEAAFIVAVRAGSSHIEFAGVLNIDAPAVQVLLRGRWNTEGS
jgi:hypothetical protein